MTALLLFLPFLFLKSSTVIFRAGTRVVCLPRGNGRGCVTRFLNFAGFKPSDRMRKGGKTGCRGRNTALCESDERNEMERRCGKVHARRETRKGFENGKDEEDHERERDRAQGDEMRIEKK